MPDAVWSFLRRTAVVACLAAGRAAAAAAAEPDPPASPDIMTRFDFHLSAASLGTDDDRFSWDTHFGGELDLVDYVVGRASLIADYEAVLGHQLRSFDPNQSYYLLEPSLSLRLAHAEVALFLQHVSRHLSDRSKPFPIAWNVLGVKVLWRVERPNTLIDVDAGIGRATEHVWVDYTWAGEANLRVRHTVRPRAALFAVVHGEMYGVDDTRGRGTQLGGRVEGGVRLGGPAGAVELFAGYERRVDADPIALVPMRWALVGFRFAR